MKKIAIPVVFILLAFVLLLAFGKAKQEMIRSVEGERVWQHLSSAGPSDTGPAAVNGDGLVDADFSSHLPLLLIDLEGGSITDLRSDASVSEASHYGENVNPYSEMILSVFDSGSVNSISFDADQILEGKIKIRGGSTADGKKQYRLKFLDAYGDDVKVPLLGMTSGDEWVLNGMDSDPSCLRSYLAYNLAGEMGLDSPDVRYCEVICKEGSAYRYLGLYLLTEAAEQGEGRVALKGKKNLVGAYSYILKRDKSDSDSVVLSTWASQEAGLSGFLGGASSSQSVLTLVYPKNEKATTDAIAYVTADVSKIEQTLASPDIATFASFSRSVNVDSFLNYFILNEFVMNPDAGIRSTYMYRDIGDKLTAGPVWGFNSAISSPSSPETFRMKDTPFFTDLLKNPTFVSRLIARYQALRESTLESSRVDSLLHDTQQYLGAALERDRSLRGISLQSYSEEVQAAGELLEQRGVWMDEHITDLQSGTVTDPAGSVRRAAMVLLSCAGLLAAGFAAIRLKTRHHLKHGKETEA